MKQRFYLAGLLPAFSALLLHAGGEFNGRMELGAVGDPVPGWRLYVGKALLKEVEPKRMHVPVVTEKGVDGQGMRIPAYPGILSCGLQSRYFLIDWNGEVEISFQYRMVSPEKRGNVRCNVDFRAFGDRAVRNAPVANPRYPHYPVLTGAGVPYSAQWTEFRRRFPVVKWHNYYLLTLNISSTDGKAINSAIELDNIRIEKVGGKKEVMEEAAVVPDRPRPVYRKNDPVRLAVSATLNSKDSVVDGVLEISGRPDPSRKILKPVRLERKKTLGDGSSLYAGTLSFPAEKFGYFQADLKVKNRKIDTLGSWSVVHPDLDHPRFTPGWSLGSNVSHYLNPYNTPHREIGKVVGWRNSGGMLEQYDIMRLCGVRLGRVWGYLRMIQREENWFDRTQMDPCLNALKERRIEPVFCLAGGAGMTFRDAGPNPAVSDYPPFLYRYLKPKTNRKGILYLDWPLDQWEKHVRNCLKSWGDSVQIWELFNEPDQNIMDASHYQKYLESSWKTVKKENPAFLLLGNGNTCDVGFEKSWCARLNQANPDYVNWMDGVAFHPYWNSTDCIGGIYNLYTRHIQELRSRLKVQKPLWNTECYYIQSARHPQVDFYLNNVVFDANDLQRHFLDGLRNGVVGAPTLAPESLQEFQAGVSRHPALSEAGVAMNALSWHLRNMKTLTAVPLGSYVRGGVFRSADGSEALGFLYDMRPKGSVFTVPEGVETMDLFGNVLPPKSVQDLSLDPVYVRGKSAVVEKFIRNPNLRANAGAVYGRKVGNEIYLNAENVWESAGVLEIEFPKDTNLPAVQFAFPDAKKDAWNVLRSPGKTPGKFRVKIGSEYAGGNEVKMLPDTAVYPLTTRESMLPFGNGQKISFHSSPEGLCFRALIRDSNVTAPEKEIFSGDALEIFIDPEPFSNLSRDRIMATVPLRAYQYVFSAAGTGPLRQWAVCRSNPGFQTKAHFQSRRTSDGYEIRGTIPWQELQLGNTPVLAIEAEITHMDSGKRLPKESLSGAKDRQAFAQRLHYPLFRPDAEAEKQLKGASPIRNTDFRSGSFGDPDFWISSSFQKKNRILFREGSIRISVQDPENLCQNALRIQQEFEIPDGAAGCVVTLLARYRNVKPTGKKQDAYWPQGIMLTVGQWDWGRSRKQKFAGDSELCCFQAYVPVGEIGKRHLLQAGLRAASGELEIQYLNLNFVK